MKLRRRPKTQSRYVFYSHVYVAISFNQVLTAITTHQDSGSNFVKAFRVYAGVLEPEEEDDSDDEDDEEEDSDGDGSEAEVLQPTELFPILEQEGADVRLPPHMRCAAHRMNNIAGKFIQGGPSGCKPTFNFVSNNFHHTPQSKGHGFSSCLHGKIQFKF